MIDFTKIEEQITKNEILSKISEFDIWKRYCSNFEEVNVSFKSEFYIDNNPSCRIYVNSNNELKYKDFGSGEHYDCWNYIQKKYNCNYYEALNIIATDFKLSDKKINISPNIILSNDEPKIHKEVKINRGKSRIEIVSQPFTIQDFNYWNQYHISLETLSKFDIFSVKRYIIIKDNKRYITEYQKNNPIYNYKFDSSDKIYKPYDKSNKWMFFGSGLIIEGYKQLPKEGNLLIITKALKDVCVYNEINYSAISFNSETINPNKEVIEELQSRFKEIVVQVDRDDAGKKMSENLQNRYNFRILNIGDTTKDFSDYSKLKGLEESKKLIEKLLKK